MRIVSWLSICLFVSSATPTQISNVVPKKGMPADVPSREDRGGHERDGGEEQRSRERDPVQDLREVLLGRWSGTDARNVPTLFADRVGLLVRVEAHLDIEEGEQDDEHAVEDEIDATGRRDRLFVPRCCIALPRQHRGDENRNESNELAKMIGMTPACSP